MNDYQEGCQLSAGEITAVLSLAGRKSVIGLRAAEVNALTSEKIWDACCALMRDGMMTQIDGKFRLSKTLVEVLQPMCQARTVLALTPGSDLYAQIIFYSGDTVSAMTRANYGGYVLRPVNEPELVDMIADHMELSFPEVPSDDQEEMPPVTVGLQDSRDALLEGAHFVIEQLDPDTGTRIGWLRLLDQGLTGWLQWTDKGGIRCEELSRESLGHLLQVLLRD